MVSRLSFGSIETKSGSKTKALKPGRWHAEVLSAKFVTANSGNEGIEVVYKIVDENAVDIDDNEYTGKVWDKIWFDAKSGKITKIKLTGIMGLDAVNSLEIDGTDDVKDLAETLNDDYAETEVVLVTEVEDDENGKEYDDGTTKAYTRVRFVNEVS